MHAVTSPLPNRAAEPAADAPDAADTADAATASEAVELAPDAAAAAYARHARPRVAQMLGAVRMDVVYETGRGNWLAYRGPGGETIEVLDALGGYGSTLFGHNHPALTGALIRAVQQARPFAAQASVRPAAARLSALLGARFEALTGTPAVVTLGNSGAEAVEAARKHAVIDRRQRHGEKLAEVKRALRLLGAQVAAGEVRPGAGFRDAYVARFGTEPPAAWAAIERALVDAAAAALGAPARHLATRGAFHGKTGGALSLTDGEHFRAPFEVATDDACVVDPFAPDAEAALEGAVAALCREYPTLEARDGELHLETAQACDVAAFFFEPIQGEGGIRTLPPALLGTARALADDHGFALVADEIQTGMGRTGRFFACEHAGVAPDYVTLSKSLGGGLCKVSALLVRADRYVDDFGLLHTSTFAEDEHGAAVASRALALLDEDALPERAASAGQRLGDALRELCRRYPTAFVETRGTGLLLGLQLRDLSDAQAPLARALSTQGLLGYVCAGFLLHHGRLRVAPSLSSPHTLRLEPSAYLSDEEIAHAVRALETLGRVLCHQDYGALLEYTTLDTRPALDAPVHSTPFTARDVVFEPWSGPAAGVRRVAFLGHFIHIDDMPRWEPSLARLSATQRRVLLDRVAPLIDPHPILQRRVRTADGREVDFMFIGVTHDSQDIEQKLLAGDTAALVAELQRAVDTAETHGCQVVGLGGYTSIVTRNGKLLTTERAALTTGNTYTAATTLQALIGNAVELGIDLPDATVGIVGGGGNIGRLMAQELAPHVRRVVLVGRAGRLERLYALAERLRAGDVETSGLVDAPRRAPGQVLEVQVTEDIGALADAGLVVGASNSATQPLAQVGFTHRPRVVCDAAVPPDAPADLEERAPGTRVVMGGLVAVPNAPGFAVPGIPLRAGHIFACMAETMTLGLTPDLTPARLGALQTDNVGRIARAAKRAGLVVAETKRARSF